MALTAPPTAPSTGDPSTFSSRMDARLAWQDVNVAEMNAFLAALAAIAAGTAMSIPYTFDSTTTDADPGAGKLRLSSATQNASATMRLDLTGADGSTWTSVIDTFDDSTSAIKGYIMLQKLNDATKWLLFSVSSLASPTGYKNITVANVASSAASPFTNGDSLILKFTAKGDKGDVGGTVTDSEVVVHTGNGHGSTNTVIRRFTTTMTNVGTAITYADSATNGASFTINETGLYSLYYTDATGGTSLRYGISVNSAQLTTDIASITVANRLAGPVDTTAVRGNPVARVVKLTAGDVVRAHTDGAASPATSDKVYFAIRKVGNL